MQLKGSKTEEKLRKAFARELHAHANYIYFAEAAREAGLEQIADMFLATAHNEAEHEENFHELLETLGKSKEFRGRTVGHSAVEMAELMLPHQTNPAGFVHGGELMKLMDNAAGVVAARHSRANLVTAMVEDINFHNPVHVGDLVLVHGKITFTSRSSMEVRIEVEAENLLTGKRLPALTAYYVMVAVSLEGKSVEVPPLIVITEEEERLFNEGLDKYKARKAKSGK